MEELRLTIEEFWDESCHMVFDLGIFAVQDGAI